MTDSDFFAHTLRFNWLPASYIDASWLSHWLASDRLVNLRSVPAAARTLNGFLLEDRALREEVPPEAFANPALQLLLWPVQEVHRLVLYLGLVMHHSRIRRIICGQAQRELKDAIGGEAYRFALKRVPFMVGALGDRFCLEAIEQPAPGGWRAELLRAGLVPWAVATEQLPAPARKRMLLYFHTDDASRIEGCWQAGLAPYLKHADTLAEAYGQIDNLLIKVAQELNPLWKPVSV